MRVARFTRVLAAVGILFLLHQGPLAGDPSRLVSISPLLGQSGKLRAVFTLPEGEPAAVERPSTRPGAYPLFRPGLDPFHLFVMVPFSAKVDGRIGSYRMGYWPFEYQKPASPLYANPRGFLEVTPENFSMPVSEHFTLGQFATKDQLEIWPKYVALDTRLLDKLELTIEELAHMGHPVRGLVIMSGFRTPEYNSQRAGRGGRSGVSRHVYGDAADVLPDDRGRGRMEDLNHDGRVDVRDARIVAAAADAVERQHPELAGGIGIYRANHAHGPFVHIDARGQRARWGG